MTGLVTCRSQPRKETPCRSCSEGRGSTLGPTAGQREPRHGMEQSRPLAKLRASGCRALPCASVPACPATCCHLTKADKEHKQEQRNLFSAPDVAYIVCYLNNARPSYPPQQAHCSTSPSHTEACLLQSLCLDCSQISSECLVSVSCNWFPPGSHALGGPCHSAAGRIHLAQGHHDTNSPRTLRPKKAPSSPCPYLPAVGLCKVLPSILRYGYRCSQKLMYTASQRHGVCVTVAIQAREAGARHVGQGRKHGAFLLLPLAPPCVQVLEYRVVRRLSALER